MMTMDLIEQILTDYAAMRRQGMDIKSSLNCLQSTIQTLGNADKVALSRRLRALETQEMPVPSALQKRKALDPEATIEYPALNLNRLACPHCGKDNKAEEIICYACGQLLKTAVAKVQTQILNQTAHLSPRDDFFGIDSVLILTAMHTRKDYEIRPQDHEGDLVVGRRTRRSPLNPDIDLSEADGNRLGVSRLHLSIRYDAQYQTLTIFDLGSANGTYVNGQRLHPHELRILRSSDDLRLGHMSLSVDFQHHHGA